MSPDVPSPIDNVPTPKDTVPDLKDIVTAEDTVKTPEDRAHVDPCSDLRHAVIQNVVETIERLSREGEDHLSKVRNNSARIEQLYQELVKIDQEINLFHARNIYGGPEYLKLHEQRRQTESLVENQARLLRDSNVPHVLALATLAREANALKTALPQFFSSWSDFGEPDYRKGPFDQQIWHRYSNREVLVIKFEELKCEEIRSIAIALGIQFVEQQEAVPKDQRLEPQQAPHYTPISQISYNIPRDWSALSRQEQQLIDQVVATNIITSGTILTAGTVKRRLPKKRTSKASQPKPKSEAKRPSPKADGEYPAGAIRQAEQALKEAQALDRAGKLPSIDEINEWYRKKLALVNTTKKEAIEAETEYDRLIDARHRVDLADSKGQRIVYAANENNVSFVRLLPDGTIHTVEMSKLGPGSYRKFEEWAYLDGKRVTWSSTFEENRSIANKGASERVFREETIDIKQSPELHDMFSSTTSVVQEIKGSIDLPEMDTKLIKPERMIEQLEELKQDHRHGPWDSVQSK